MDATTTESVDRATEARYGRPARPELEDLRFAVVLNGGVSLAIWMGGVVHEIDRLAKGRSAYRLLLEWANSTARVDVVTGTSAGGINGAALALSTCNAHSRGLGQLRDTWIESGSLSRMLREPFRGSPPSLLQGDEFFLVELNRAMKGLTVDYEPRPVDECPMDLAITCTLLNGVTSVATDAVGQKVGQVRHDGLFRFQRGPSSRRAPDQHDDFGPEAIGRTVDALALASRTTASFPVAFEPSLVPTSEDREPGDPVARLRPDMRDYLGGAWDDQVGDKAARYAVDGGVLANTPTKPALEAIDRMPVTGPVRRVMLMVHPHAGRPGANRSDAAPPTLTGLGGSLATALMSQGNRNYADEVERHNDLAGGRRRLRADVVMRTRPDELVQRAAAVVDWYRAKRHERIARDLAATWIKARAGREVRPFGDVVRAVVDAMAQAGWSPKMTGGFEGALGVSDAATDYLKRRCWADDDPEVHRARRVVSAVRDDILTRRQEFLGVARAGMDPDGTADGPAATGDDGPSVAQWLADLRTHYDAGGEGSTFGNWVDQIAAALAGLPVSAEVGDPHLQTRGEAEVLHRFHALLGLDRSVPGLDPGTDARAVDVRIRLQALDTITYVLSDEITTGASLPVELVQMTFDVEHPFAPGLTGEQKVAGDLVGRFSGFLKRSWRVNDWTWGRLDAIESLCRVVLDPDRVRRHLAAVGADEAARTDLVRDLFTDLFAEVRLDGLPTPEELERELTALVDPPPDGGPATLDVLPRLFAARLALDAAGDDLPELPVAVAADIEEGANDRAPGVVGVTSNPHVYRAARSGGSRERWEALNAFGRSGIGRDPLSGEASSDSTIGTVARAAAVTVSVLDADSSGLGFAKPVTSALRGSALLPYWAVTGLTSSGRLARALSLGALAVGGVLLTLGLFGVGPTWGVAVGAGTVLGVFAFSALRTGTVLHGALLLLPAVGVLAWAAYRAQHEPDPATGGTAATTTGVPVLLAVLGLAAGLALLGALRPPIRSPLHWVATRSLQLRLTAAALVLVVVLWAVLPGAATAVADSVARSWEWGVGVLSDVPAPILVVVAVLVVAAAGGYALWVGTRWRLVVRSATGEWVTESVEHPVGVSVGWSWVYGVLTALAAVLVAWRGDFRAPTSPEYWAALVALAVTSALLLLPLPLLMDRRARRLTDDRVAAALRSPTPGDPEDRLLAAGLNYRYLLEPDGTRVALTAHARALVDRGDEDAARPPSPSGSRR